jgi:hypothetical protein
MFSTVAFSQFQQQGSCPDLAATNIQRGRYVDALLSQ